MKMFVTMSVVVILSGCANLMYPPDSSEAKETCRDRGGRIGEVCMAYYADGRCRTPVQGCKYAQMSVPEFCEKERALMKRKLEEAEEQRKAGVTPYVGLLSSACR